MPMEDVLSIPTRVEYDLGGNMHGQPVKLVRDSGRWVLLRGAANQRDDEARVEITDLQLAAIARIQHDGVPA